MTLWRRLQWLFHRHHWQLRVDKHRIYLACDGCPATTHGIRIPSGSDYIITVTRRSPKPSGVIDAKDVTLQRKLHEQSDRYFN